MPNQPDHETPHDAMTRQEEVALDQGVYNPFMEQADEMGTWPEQPTRIPHRAAVRRRPVREPRHGDSESDLGTPDYYQSYVTPTAEELAERAAVLVGPGHRAAVVAGVTAAHDAVMKETAGEGITYQLARERAAQEKRNRRIHGE